MNLPIVSAASKLAALRRACPAPDLFLDRPDDIEPYGRDWTGEAQSMPLAVARPRDAATVAALLGACCELRLPVVPQGGRTGLVRAALPKAGRSELVISLARMSAVRSVSALDYALVAEAGCILEDAKRAAEAADCLLPISFGAQGSCRLGGNVATNAGGFNVLRYGMTRDLVLGLEVALPDGTLWNGLRTLRKDNRGPDLKQIFIGSEGTLGIVTAVALKLFPRPGQVETAIVGLGSIADAMAFHAFARRACSDLLSAFELILRPAVEVALRERPDFREPLASGPCPVYVLMELAAGGAVDLRQVLEACLAGTGERLVDGTIAASQAQAERLWAYREVMVERQGRGRPYLRTDVSVPISAIDALVEGAQRDVAAHGLPGDVIAYGHVGDGNLHINVIPHAHLSQAAAGALMREAEEVIFRVVDALGGSISAEHGIGRKKREAFLQRADPQTLDLQRRLKDVLDPFSILSDGRILPSRGEARP